MTISASYFDHVKYPAQEFIDRDKDFIGNGVLKPATDLTLTYLGGMTVNITAGTAWVNGLRIGYDANPTLSLTFANADATNPRVDLIEIGATGTGTQGKGVIQIVKGVAASSPLQPQPDTGFIGLYAVSIAANATQITSSDVTDLRSGINIVGATTMQLAQSAPGEQTFNTTGSAGTSSKAAREDHVHPMANLTPSSIGAEPYISESGKVTDFWSGAKTFRDLATDVRNVILTGLSTATNAAISTADSILSALGKLQSQITAHMADDTAHGIGTHKSAFNQNFETSASNIVMNGTASAGASNNVARADHVHPSDTTKLSVSGGTMTGNLTVPFLTSNTGMNVSGSIVNTSPSANLELGSLTTSTNNTPYIDFHSAGANNDYDARIIADGGTAGQVGSGNLSLDTKNLNLNATNTYINGSAQVHGNLMMFGDIVSDGAERRFAASSSNVYWGYYVNNSSFGGYDWVNGKGVFDYNIANQILTFSANKVSTNHNTLDDGNGNASVSGDFNTSGILYTHSNTGQTITDANMKPLVVQSDSSHAALMTFIRNSSYAVQFGLDVTNRLSVGGWSMGSVSYQLLDTRDFQGSGGTGLHRITTSTSGPSGGNDGDIWFQYS